jgi:SAM-dependent methyltransferase
MTEEQSVWEQPDRVEKFADRTPDVRLMKLVESYDDPAAVSVLDLGSAAGRNTVALLERGYDVYAVDSSSAMTAKARERLAETVGEQEAEARVRKGLMEDLSDFDDGMFDLVVALGVYHNAHDRTQWDRSLAETARVLAPGGLLLVANFTPRTDPNGEGTVPVEGEHHVYIAFGSERVYLLEQDELDAEMARYGFEPVTPSETVTKKTESGRRVTVNALYRKRPE